MKRHETFKVWSACVLVASALGTGFPAAVQAEAPLPPAVGDTASVEARPAAAALRAGAARIDITPKDLKGFWAVWAKPYTGVHDPIFARALVLSAGGTTVALVSTDLVEFGDTTALRQRIQKKLGIPADNIVISASHDHGAPRAGPITPGSSSAQGRPYSPPSYLAFVDDQVLAAVREAKAGLQPASIGVGKGRSDINIDRYGYDAQTGKWNAADPDGPSTKTVWVVKVADRTGKPIAILMNYAVHSVVAGPNSTLITGDLAGYAERTVEQHYGEKTVALFTMGPAGDQNPRYMDTGQDPGSHGAVAFEGVEALGFVLGREVVRATDSIGTLQPTASIVAHHQDFFCATTPPRPKQSGKAMEFPANPAFHEVIPRPDAHVIQLSTIRINDIALTGVSAEIYTRIYDHLRKVSPLDDTILITMANDRIGYLASDSEYGGPYSKAEVVKGCAEAGIVSGLSKMIEQP